MLGGMSYSAVSKTYERFSCDVETDRKIRKMVERIERELPNV